MYNIKDERRLKNMIILVGASASGKTEIAKILIEKHNYKKCITTTTRPLREKEVDGLSYHFLSKEEFLKLKKENAFVETACYQNEYYGTQKKDISKAGVIILEPCGANKIVEYLKENAFVVLIESSKALREKRMIIRGDKEDKIKQRLEKDDLHFAAKNLNKLDLLLINKKQTLKELANIINESYQNYCR